MNARLKVAIIGDRGIPARYSGFSTLVEEIATRLVADHGMDVTVYCRSQYFDHRPPEFKGVRLTYLRAPGGKSFESLLHSSRAILHAAFRAFDVVFVVDPGNGPLCLPLVLAGKPFSIHTDGKGWQRTKWSRVQRLYYRWSEWWSARLATWLVTDSPAMGDYYLEEYGAPSTYIPYGSQVGGPPDAGVLAEFGLQSKGFYLVVARLEPENNVDWIISEYRRSGCKRPLVYVGGARYESVYSRSVEAEHDGRVLCVGPIYDPERLNGLYHHCRCYFHGHEVGGTNPSLLRAMGAGAPCVPIDVVYHREVLGPEGRFFAKQQGCLAAVVAEIDDDQEELRRLAKLSLRRAQALYRWDAVAAAYATLFRRMAKTSRSEIRTLMQSDNDLYRPASFVSDNLGPGAASIEGEPRPIPPRRTRTAIVCPGLGRERRGYERITADLVLALGEELDVHLFKGAGPPSERERVMFSLARDSAVLMRLPLHRLIGRTRYHVECLTFAISLLLTNALRGFELVFTYDPAMLKPLYWIRKLTGARYRILFAHGGAFPFPYWPHADVVLHSSPLSYQEDVDRGIAPEKFALLPIGIWPERFDVPLSRTELRRKYGISDETLVVLSISALDRRQKRVDHLIEEVARVEGDVLLWIDGSPNFSADRTLIDLAQERLGERCRITYGSSERVGDLYALADVMVIASLHEGFGLAIVEALCSGTPTLTHSSPHFKWLVGEPRLLVDMACPGALAARLQALVGNAEALRATIDRENFRRKYSWQALKSEFAELFRRVAHGETR